MPIFGKPFLEECSKKYNTEPVDEEQLDLTGRILVPALGEIERELGDLRKSFDARILYTLEDSASDHARFARDPLYAKHVNNPFIRSPSKYPVGYCMDITNGVWDDVSLQLKKPNTPGMSALKTFVSNGGILKKIAGIQHKKYFQNGMQAGSLWVDVANNTVDKDYPPINICGLSDSGFENVDDIASYSDVVESYWGDSVYPNRVFPSIAHLFPVVRILQSGMLRVEDFNDSIFATNILSGFQLAEDFIFKSRFAGRRLPMPYKRLIEDMFYRGSSIRLTDTDDTLMRDVFRSVRSLDPDDLDISISDGLNTMEYINDIVISV